MESSFMNSREFAIQQTDNLLKSFKEIHVLMSRNEELGKANIAVQKQLSVCQHECQRLRSEAFAAERAAVSHATENDGRFLHRPEELDAEVHSSNSMLRKAIESLTAESAEKDRLLAENHRFLDEKAALSRELENVKRAHSQEQAARHEEVKSLRQELEQCQSAGSSQDDKLYTAQATIGSLKSKLSDQSQALEECRQLVVELQIRQAELEMENNLVADKLLDAQQTASQEQDYTKEQFYNAESEIQQLRAMVSKQEKEIVHMRAEHARTSKCPSQTAPIEKTYCSVAVEAVPAELPKVVPSASVARASGSTAKTQRPKRPLKRSHSQAFTAATQNKPLDLTKYASPVPDVRRGLLDTVPEVDVVLPPGTENITFTRTTLSHILGGSPQPLIVSITNSMTPLAAQYSIKGFLCPKMDHNPWLPTIPGKHGFMQVGLGKEKETFKVPKTQHVFAGAGQCYKYSGLYKVWRVDPLSVAEWNTLPEEVRGQYVRTTSKKEKTANHGSDATIRNMYDSGELLAPCVLLQCIEFDVAFYRDLIAAKDQSPSQENAKKTKLTANREEEVDSEGDDDTGDEIDGDDASGEQRITATPSGTSISTSTVPRKPRRSGRLLIKIPAIGSIYCEDSPDDGER